MEKEEVKSILKKKFEETYKAYDYVVNLLLSIPACERDDTDNYYYEWFLEEQEFLLKSMFELKKQ